MTAPALSVAPRKARLARYALWQSGDFLFNVAIITIILFALIGVATLMSIHAQEAMFAARQRAMPDPGKVNMFREIYAMFAMVAPIIAVSGMVSQDRAGGFTRFLFAKPVSPRRFYFQSLVVRYVGFLAVAHVLILWWGLYEPPAYTPRFLVDLTIHFVLVGGIVFLLSVVSKFDGLVAIVVLLTSSMCWDKWENASGAGHALIQLLPPIGKVGEIHMWLLRVNPLGGAFVDPPFPTKWSLWLAGYGLACIALGLYLLRRIPLTKA